MRLRVQAFAVIALAAALSGVGPVVGLGASPAAADTTLYFEGETTATAIHLILTQQPASSIITAGLVDDAAAYAAGGVDSSGGSEAQAAPLYPGNLVIQGPALFCEDVFTCPVNPPDYPLLAAASYPRAMSAHAQSNQSPVGSGPLVVAPASADATAHAQDNAASTSTAKVTLLAGTPAATTIGASTATSSVTATATALTMHVESTVTDVTIGGLVHIASVRTIDDIVLRPGTAPVDKPIVTVSGVTVAGESATIDDTGLHVAGQKGPSLTQRVAQLGVAIETVGVSKADQTMSARSDATGLSIDFGVPISGVPYVPNPLPSPFDAIPGVDANGTYVGTITLGAAGAVGAAQTQPGFDLNGPIHAMAMPSPPPPAAAPPPQGSTLIRQLAGRTIPGAPVVAAPPVRLHGVLDAFSVADLYAVLALGSTLMFLGWRATLLLRPAGRHG